MIPAFAAFFRPRYIEPDKLEYELLTATVVLANRLLIPLLSPVTIFSFGSSEMMFSNGARSNST